MATNESHADAPPQAVWKVIATPGLYADWVVGSKEVRDADATWPDPSSTLHHTSGFGPIEIKDTTEVIEATPNEHIRLEARLGKLGTAIVTIDLREDADGTQVSMNEEFVEGLPSKLDAATDALLKGRNEETLRRLVRLAEGKR